MKSNKKFSASSIIIFLLVAIGVLSAFRNSFWKITLFITLIGLIFYLYKQPPLWLLRMTKHSPQPKKKKRKSYPFKVIDGSKKGRKL